MLVIFAVSRALGESDVTFMTMGYFGAAISISMSVSCFLGGKLSDCVGRKQMVVIGMVLQWLAIAGCAQTGPTSHLRLAAYCGGGFAMGLIYPSVYAWLSSGSGAGRAASGVGRSVVLFALTWNAGVVSGQAGGGWLFGLDMNAPIYAALALISVNFVLLFFLSAAPRSVAPPDETHTESHAADAARRALAYAFAKMAWLANLGSACAMSITIYLLPRLMDLRKIEPEQHGLILAITRAAVIATYLLMFWQTFWRTRFGLVFVSHVLAAGGLMTVYYARDVWVLTLGLVAAAQLSGFNYFASLYYSTTGSRHDNRATATGIHEATHLLGFAIGTLLGGFIGDHFNDPAEAYRFAAGLIVVLTVAQIVIYFTKVRPMRQRVLTA